MSKFVFVSRVAACDRPKQTSEWQPDTRRANKDEQKKREKMLDNFQFTLNHLLKTYPHSNSLSVKHRRQRNPIRVLRKTDLKFLFFFIFEKFNVEMNVL